MRNLAVNIWWNGINFTYDASKKVDDLNFASHVFKGIPDDDEEEPLDHDEL
jgi:hypothetical protein